MSAVSVSAQSGAACSGHRSSPALSAEEDIVKDRGCRLRDSGVSKGNTLHNQSIGCNLIPSIALGCMKSIERSPRQIYSGVERAEGISIRTSLFSDGDESDPSLNMQRILQPVETFCPELLLEIGELDHKEKAAVRKTSAEFNAKETPEHVSVAPVIQSEKEPQQLSQVSQVCARLPLQETVKEDFLSIHSKPVQTVSIIPQAPSESKISSKPCQTVSEVQVVRSDTDLNELLQMKRRVSFKEAAREPLDDTASVNSMQFMASKLRNPWWADIQSHIASIPMRDAARMKYVQQQVCRVAGAENIALSCMPADKPWRVPSTSPDPATLRTAAALPTDNLISEAKPKLFD
eukprot:gnl/MRDRNA2_/MRDRNA2_85609_c0_seq3.p1 gnl/MRDRNA2_/MRDRNA2_85609_c0~~gnl/MRDRNA2_/MRDRNA2_85609_c0_seq3.p1  ORF type:complete len:360 (+),score=68.83 gnl/MRDRNA2_/MRDRNA2_85609_c0_seq3:39-1082(+)